MQRAHEMVICADAVARLLRHGRLRIVVLLLDYAEHLLVLFFYDNRARSSGTGTETASRACRSCPSHHSQSMWLLPPAALIHGCRRP